MTPDFALTFPVAQDGAAVTLKYPVLINPTTVLKPGMVLRTLYVLSYDAGGATDLALAHHGSMEEAYSRPLPGSSNHPDLPPALTHEIEGYRRTVWQVANNFVLAMAQLPTDNMHLIYSTTGRDQDLRDERFSFFDGLFVGQPNGGKVTVVAVEKESKAEAAGLKAGDEILSIGGIPTQDSLTTFAGAYATAKKTATDYEAASYSLTIRPGGTGEPRQVNIAMPPSLKGGLMDGFNDAPPPKPAPKKPAAP
jgi:membrane-associated protease RseP (regulator of RpoE activity)